MGPRRVRNNLSSIKAEINMDVPWHPELFAHFGGDLGIVARHDGDTHFASLLVVRCGVLNTER